MTSAESNRLPSDRAIDPPKSGLATVFLAVLAIVGAGLLFVSLIYKRHPPIGLHHPNVGEHMANVKLEPLLNADQAIDTYDLRGKVVLIDFWGPWCGYCLKEFPELLPLERKYRDRNDVQFLLVSYPGRPSDDREEFREESKEVIESFKADTPIYHDPDRQLISEAIESARMQQRFAFPTTMVLDRSGEIRAIWTGQSDVSEFGRVIEQLLAEKPG
jgi:thiol-disulfide isomerase/thioredoxin